MTERNKLSVTPGRRADALEARRKLKMASSAHAYMRGSTVQFYQWLEGRGRRSVPKGPAVWICGDCHAGNLGPLAAPDGKVHVQIRDLDALMGPRAQNQIESDKPKSIKVVMRRAPARTWKHLARERLQDVKPRIPRGERFWPLTKEEGKAIDALFENEQVRKLVTSLKSRPDDAAIAVLDAAYWMKGCSSLGRLRFAVLLSVAAGKKHDDEFCLIDIKEAAAAAAPHAPRAVMPKDPARRVVAGAKHLSPALGERMMASRLLGRSVVIRELMPQDLKLDIDQLSRREAVNSARYLAEVLGNAHARQMNDSTRREFASSFKWQKAAHLNAPSWLWSSVVELASTHEAAYLEHCRRYALGS